MGYVETLYQPHGFSVNGKQFSDEKFTNKDQRSSLTLEIKVEIKDIGGKS